MLCFSVSAIAQQTETENTADAEPPASPLIELGGDYHNSIELLQNRFRIDYLVDEITLVFFREFGSAPIVLVKPDGSKIFQAQADGENIFWYDSNTYDMISLKNPTPGPWQAIGRILPESRVMVLSDVRLNAETLPPMIFSGEILKQTAYLTNGDAPINYSQFRDVVNLSIELTSTNNPDFNNFGAKSETVATFEDNGLGMDEAPLDGTFTGQFNLAIAAGEWQPVFRVSTPLFTREQIDEPLILHPNPIKIDVEIDGGGEGYHKLLIDAERHLVDISSLLLDGKVRFPNGDIQNFSLTELSDQTREHLVVNYEYGVFRVKVTAYGKTINGRDFILDVPEFNFVTDEPEPVIEPTAVQPDEAEMSMDSAMEEGMPLEMTGQEPEFDVMFWIMLINGSILLIGGIAAVIIVVVKKRSTQSSNTESWLEKIKNMLPSKKVPES